MDFVAFNMSFQLPEHIGAVLHVIVRSGMTASRSHGRTRPEAIMTVVIALAPLSGPWSLARYVSTAVMQVGGHGRRGFRH